MSLTEAMVENLHLSDPSKDEGTENDAMDDQDHMEQGEIADVENGEEMEEEDEDDFENEEDYSALNKQLDDLNSALDILEQKNDNITAQLLELLQNSREVRKTLADERAQGQATD